MIIIIMMMKRKMIITKNKNNKLTIWQIYKTGKNHKNFYKIVKMINYKKTV